MSTGSLAGVRSLYIHWPFCLYRCHFCPFTALAEHSEYQEKYYQALKKEILIYAQQIDKTTLIETMFIGGGTPSICPDALLLDMSVTLYEMFNFSSTCETTIEINPGSVTADKLVLYKTMGINRVSFGVQSLNETALQALNRKQYTRDVYSALRDATAVFENISIDLMLGIPGVSPEEWKKEIQEIVTWPIQHVSVYFFTIHEDTPFYFKALCAESGIMPDDEITEAYKWTIYELEKHGFYQYEISNFARSGYESRHNRAYWQRVPYRGFGLGACSFDGQSRVQNEQRLMSYIESLEANVMPEAYRECLTEQQVWLEMVMLGLRQRKGVALKEIVQSFTDVRKKRFMELVDLLVNEGMVEVRDSVLSITVQGLPVAQEIMTKLTSI